MSKQTLMYPTQTTFFHSKNDKWQYFSGYVKLCTKPPSPLFPLHHQTQTPFVAVPNMKKGRELLVTHRVYPSRLCNQTLSSTRMFFQGFGVVFFFFFFWDVLTAGQLVRNASLDSENTSPAQVSNPLYITYRFCNWIDSWGSEGHIAPVGLRALAAGEDLTPSSSCCRYVLK